MIEGFLAAMKDLLVNPSVADRQILSVIGVPLILNSFVAGFHRGSRLVLKKNWWMLEPTLSVWLHFICSLLKSFQTLVVCSSFDYAFLRVRGACGCKSSNSWLLWWKYGCRDRTSWLWLLAIVLIKVIRGVATADILQMRWVLIVAGETRIFAWVFCCLVANNFFGRLFKPWSRGIIMCCRFWWSLSSSRDLSWNFPCCSFSFWSGFWFSFLISIWLIIFRWRQTVIIIFPSSQLCL